MVAITYPAQALRANNSGQGGCGRHLTPRLGNAQQVTFCKNPTTGVLRCFSVPPPEETCHKAQTCFVAKYQHSLHSSGSCARDMKLLGRSASSCCVYGPLLWGMHVLHVLATLMEQKLSQAKPNQARPDGEKKGPTGCGKRMFAAAENFIKSAQKNVCEDKNTYGHP